MGRGGELTRCEWAIILPTASNTSNLCSHFTRCSESSDQRRMKAIPTTESCLEGTPTYVPMRGRWRQARVRMTYSSSAPPMLPYSDREWTCAATLRRVLGIEIASPRRPAWLSCEYGRDQSVPGAHVAHLRPDADEQPMCAVKNRGIGEREGKAQSERGDERPIVLHHPRGW